MSSSRRGQRGLHRCADVTGLGHVMGRLAKLEHKFNELVGHVTEVLCAPTTVSEWARDISERVERIELLLFSCDFNQFHEIDALLKGLREMPDMVQCASKVDRTTLLATSLSECGSRRSDSLSSLPDSRASSPASVFDSDTTIGRGRCQRDALSSDAVAESLRIEFVDKHKEDACKLTYTVEDLEESSALAAAMVSCEAASLRKNVIEHSVEGDSDCILLSEAIGQHTPINESASRVERRHLGNSTNAHPVGQPVHRPRAKSCSCSECSSTQFAANCKYCGIQLCRSCRRFHCCVSVDGAFDQFISHYFTFSTEEDIKAASYTCTLACDTIVETFHQIDSAREANPRRVVQS